MWGARNGSFRLPLAHSRRDAGTVERDGLDVSKWASPDATPLLAGLLVPLGVALRSMLAESEAKIASAAPAEKARLQERAEVLREWLTLKSTSRSP